MSETGIRFAEERRRFPVTEKYAYLDHASRGPLSPAALEMVERFTREQVMVHPDQLARMNGIFRAARQGIASLLGCREESVAFAPSTSSGIAMAAGSLPIEEGDNVICSRGEFPSNVYPWMNLARRGVEVRFLEPAPAGVTADQVREAMDGRTKVVALSWVAFSTGTRIDTQAVAELCRGSGAFFVVDAIQGVGALEADLAGIDILVCGGGKWTLAPQGGGFVYLRPGLIEELHPDRVGWLSMASTADFEHLGSLTDYRFELAHDARRVETGSNSLLTQPALGASCAYLHELGIRSVERRIFRLCDRLIEGLARSGIPLTHPVIEGRRSGIVCFTLPDAEAAARRLVERGVIVSAREGRIRAGIHFYNNEEDIERLLAEL